MLKGLVDSLKEKKKRLQELKNSNNNKEEKTFDITISKDNNVCKIEISDYLLVNDYVERMKLIDENNLGKLLSFNILWNSEKQRINKGTFYLINSNDNFYNILINDDIIKIDQRNKDGNITEEKILSFDKNTQDYNYCSLKHNETGSTIFTKYYSKKSTNVKNLELSKNEAFYDIYSIACNLENIDGIDNILSIDLLKYQVLNDISRRLFSKSKSKVLKYPYQFH